MEERIDAFVLWARASCVGLLAFALGVVGHVMAGGLLPGPLLLVVLLLGAVVVSAATLTQPASPLRLVTMLVAGQTFIHVVLAATAGHRGDAPSSAGAAPLPAGPQALPLAGGHRVGSLQDVYQGMSGQATTTTPTLPVGHLLNDLSAHAPMMALHLAAAALVGLWLAVGERCLWTLLAITGRRILAAARVVASPHAVPEPALVSATVSAPLVASSRWQARPQPRRGPPRLAR